MEIQSGLKFIKFDVTKVLFDRGNENKITGKYNIKVNCTCNLNIENANLFMSSFFIDIIDQDEKLFSLQIKALGFFEIVGTVEDPIRNNFMHVSAPAIVYPYIRSFVSNFLLQSGMQPIILPPMNFIAKVSEIDKGQNEVALKKSVKKKTK